MPTLELVTCEAVSLLLDKIGISQAHITGYHSFTLSLISGKFAKLKTKENKRLQEKVAFSLSVPNSGHTHTN